MSQRVMSLRVIILALLLGAVFLVWFPQGNVSAQTSKYLTVNFLNVGQGDAIHVTTPDGFEMLIDGGPSSGVLRELAKDRSFFDREIDVVVATHPDTDHVAGLVDVFERYQVDMLVETGAESDSSAALLYEEAARAEGARIITAEAGQLIQLGASTTVRILSPRGDTENWETNTASVVVQIIYGDTEFMLTGDAPSSIEEYMVGEFGDFLESEVLKLGHHGSKTASSESFLDAVSPEYAVVSAGANNRYGHPHQDVVEKVQERGIEMVSTSEEGTIKFLSDGQKVWMK